MTSSAKTRKATPLSADPVTARAQRLFRLQRAGDQHLAADRRFCREDRRYWIEHYGWVVNPKDPDPEERKVPFVLWPRQVELLGRAEQARQEQKPLLVRKGRELGVTWELLYLFVHAFLFEEMFSGLVGSWKEQFVDNGTLNSLFGKMRFILEHQPPHLLPNYQDTSMRLLNLENGAEIIGESTNPNWGRSGRASMILLDEFAQVEPSVQDQIWTGIESVAGCKLIPSTPRGKGNKFHYLDLMLSDDKKMVIDWSANPTRTQEWFDGLLLDNGGNLTRDERAQEHACSFAGVSGHHVFEFDKDAAGYDDDDLPAPARDLWTLACAMDFGSGPSLTVFGGGLVDWGDPPKGPPTIWIDTVRFWQRVPSHEIAKDAQRALLDYHGKRVIVGDPAGIAVEHDQESWQSSLQGSGLPVYCLPAKYNDHYEIGKTIEEVQQGLQRGWIRIHRTRCAILLEALEAWQWDLPASIPLELINKAEIKPRKDQWSHFGDMLRYLVGFVLRELRPRGVAPKPNPELAPPKKPKTIFGELRGGIEEDGIGVGSGWPTV